MHAADRAKAFLYDLVVAGVYDLTRASTEPVFLRIAEKLIREVEQQAADCHTETLRRRTGL